MFARETYETHSTAILAVGPTGILPLNGRQLHYESRQNMVAFLNIGLQNTFVLSLELLSARTFSVWIPLAGTVFLWRAIFQEPGAKVSVVTITAR